MPALADWTSHLSQIWTDVRLRQTLELRAADGLPYQYIPAVPALWVGLTYHPASRKAAWELLQDHTPEDYQTTMWELPIKGLTATFGRDSVREIGGELARLARIGLQARVDAGIERPAVLRYLDPIEEILDTGTTFAEDCVRRWDSDFGRDPGKYVVAYRI